MDDLEVRLSNGNSLLEYHTSDIFPERWFDLVVVLRTKTEILYDRLVGKYHYFFFLCSLDFFDFLIISFLRGYKKNKIDENMECEIMCIPYEDAVKSYKKEIVSCFYHELGLGPCQ